MNNQNNNILASAKGEGNIIIPWLPTMRLGGGYDTDSLSVKGLAGSNNPITDLTLETVGGPPGTHSSDLTIKRIENTEELFDSLNIKASLHASYGLFSANASASFLKETKINTYSIYFFIESFVMNNAQQIKKFALDDIALKCQPDEFREKFGNYYVAGVIKGGAYYLLLDMATKSREVKQDVSASLEANYTGTFSIGGKFSTDIKKAATHKGVNMNLQKVEIGVSNETIKSMKNIDFTKVEDLLNAAQEFPSKVAGGGEPMYAILAPYSDLEKAPPLTGDLDTLTLNSLRDQLLQTYFTTKKVQDSVNYALDSTNIEVEFNTTRAKLEKVQQQVATVMLQIRNAWDKLKNWNDKTTPLEIYFPAPPPLTDIPRQYWGNDKAGFPVPDSVYPATLGFAMAQAWKLTDNLPVESQRNDLENYLETLRTNWNDNFGRAKSYIDNQNESMEAMLTNALGPDNNRAIFADLLANARKNKQVLQEAIANEKAQFDALSGNSLQDENPAGKSIKPPDNKLSPYERTLYIVQKQLNHYLHDNGNIKYGGLKFWDEIITSLTDLKGKCAGWPASANGSEVIDYNEELWTGLSAEFEKAQTSIFKHFA